MGVSGEKMTLSNSGTMVPGWKLPNDPPLRPDGHVEYCFAKSVNDDSSDCNLSSIMFASSTVGTNMCLAVALMASGGAPYFFIRVDGGWMRRMSDISHII